METCTCHLDKMKDGNCTSDEEDDFVFLSKEELILKCKELRFENQKLRKQLDNFNLQRIKNIKKKEHKQRPFHFESYRSHRIALKFLYLGWDYQGLANQETTNNTIEDAIFNAMIKAKLIEDRVLCKYSRCGRTDKGVSAFGQVIALNVRSNTLVSEEEDTREEISYVRLLNKILPPEIRMLAFARVPQDFDARFDCDTRMYKYFFPAKRMDIKLMDAAAQKFVGEKDFRNFCKVDVGNNVNHFIRNIVSFKVQMLNNVDLVDICEMEITGLAFLWHQVRCMVAVLLLIGLGVEKPEIIDHLLDVESCPKRPQYELASEIPLVLYDCTYDDKINWCYDIESNTQNVNILQKKFTIFTVQSAIIASMLKDLNANSNTSVAGILPTFKEKDHKPIDKRAVCEGLNRHLEKQTAKRLKRQETSASRTCIY
ncbi:tRNA pseudouridine(38/39) synthase isoform X1 [Hydra vulgaris]|nr:tRNA pseudouridine(38/39) synthase [Hydra vulgaris]